MQIFVHLPPTLGNDQKMVMGILLGKKHEQTVKSILTKLGPSVCSENVVFCVGVVLGRERERGREHQA
jgi:xanthosine utilization system XapX-like protein